jgi:AraC-like DNA-binding protein
MLPRLWLFRRLQLAREYMYSSTGEPISLEDVAKESNLSRYHLHRAFTRVFQQTPHAYLTALRLERAQTLLKRGGSVTETCMEVGFSSVASFSRLFRRHHGPHAILSAKLRPERVRPRFIKRRKPLTRGSIPSPTGVDRARPPRHKLKRDPF